MSQPIPPEDAPPELPPDLQPPRRHDTPSTEWKPRRPPSIAFIETIVLLGLGLAAAVFLFLGTALASAFGLPFHAMLAAGTILAFVTLSFILRFASSSVTLAPGVVSPVGLLVATVLGVLLAALSNTIMIVLTELSPWLAEQAEHREQLILDVIRPGEPAYLLTVIVVVSLLPGLLEELYFRGALREKFHRRSATWRIIAIGLVFAVIHFDVVGFIPLVLVGLVLGWMAERTGGWLLCAVAHAAHNGFAIALANIAVAAEQASPEAADTVPGLPALLGIAALAALLLWTSARFVPRSTSRLDSAAGAPARPGA